MSIMRQLIAFAKSVCIVIWFYVIPLFITNMFYRFCQEPSVFFKQHQQLVSGFCYVIIFCGVFLIDPVKEQFLKQFNLQKWKETPRFILWGIGAYCLSVILNALLIKFFPDYIEIRQIFSDYEPFLRFLNMVVLAPFVEEYLFREKIQNWLKEGYGKEIGIVGQALLFGGLHHYMLQKIYATLLGSLLGIIREKKDIQATICMHMTINLIGWLIGGRLS